MSHNFMTHIKQLQKRSQDPLPSRKRSAPGASPALPAAKRAAAPRLPAAAADNDDDDDGPSPAPASSPTPTTASAKIAASSAAQSAASRLRLHIQIGPDSNVELVVTRGANPRATVERFAAMHGLATSQVADLLAETQRLVEQTWP